MPLIRIPHPFDSLDWIFELKHDGFRPQAHIDGHRRRLVSRRGHVFAKFTLMAEEIAHSVRADRAVLDAEIVRLEQQRQSQQRDSAAAGMGLRGVLGQATELVSIAAAMACLTPRF